MLQDLGVFLLHVLKNVQFHSMKNICNFLNVFNLPSFLVVSPVIFLELNKLQELASWDMSSAVSVTLHLLWPSVCWLASECGGSQKSSTRRTWTWTHTDAYWLILTHSAHTCITTGMIQWRRSNYVYYVKSSSNLWSIRSISGDNELRKGGSGKPSHS